jgi:hypothetical protein
MDTKNSAKNDEGKKFLSAKNQLKSFLTDEGDDKERVTSQIADLFLYCTVPFADIAGFTAWSSSREPKLVFVLLHTVYQAFDTLAKRRNVFKVETIGDCYVEVTGLPEAQPKHAVIMSRFAYKCRHRMNQFTKELEVQLGPETGELSMRMGLNSGPVTAGVLLGSNAQFQLFGDTVNTGMSFSFQNREVGRRNLCFDYHPYFACVLIPAARMESTGVKDKIQISKTTTNELIAADKEHWIRPREEG